MENPQLLPDRQISGRVTRSETVWDRKDRRAAEAAFENSPAGVAIRQLEGKLKATEKELAGVTQTLRELRGEGGINVQLPIITLEAIKGGVAKDESTRETQYTTVGGILYTGDYDVTNLTELE